MEAPGEGECGERGRIAAGGGGEEGRGSAGDADA